MFVVWGQVINENEHAIYDDHIFVLYMALYLGYILWEVLLFILISLCMIREFSYIFYVVWN